MSVKFDDKTIQDIFGFEDAESESIGRLKEYFLKIDTYQRVTADLPIRLLVGHKGTGKSALFKVAISEEKEKQNLPILIKPDDIAELGHEEDDFLKRIRQWKTGLSEIIGQKVFDELNIKYKIDNESKSIKVGSIISFIVDTIKLIKDQVQLDRTQQALIERFLETKKIIVFIDDLDRGWEGKKDDIKRISALLNSIRDLSNENPGLMFKVSLRSDVYYLVRTSDESTDKIEGSVVWCRWENHDILVLLIKRILTYLQQDFNETLLKNTPQEHLGRYLDDIMEKRFEGRGKWHNAPMYRIIMTMIRKRPRDIVKLCSLAAHKAQEANCNKIGTNHFQAIFEEYSQGRLQDTINEYKSELPSIEKLLLSMRPSRKEKEQGKGFLYTEAELIKKLNNIRSQYNFIFKNGKSADAKELAQFLYKINFITARKTDPSGFIKRKYFEENRYLSSTFSSYGYDWEVHPAFRWALQPDDIDDIFARLD